MPLFTEYELRTTPKADDIASQSQEYPVNDTARKFDIFLSCGFSDSELIKGLKLDIESMGYTVYLNLPIPDPAVITKDRANMTIEKMKNCSSFLFAFTENSAESKWMAWELGYFEGYSGRAAILPILNEKQNFYTGDGYFGIYPYIAYTADTVGGRKLQVHETYNKHVDYDAWLAGKEPYIHHNTLIQSISRNLSEKIKINRLKRP